MRVNSNREKQIVGGGKTSFGQRLAEGRRTRGMTQANVGKMLDISFQAVSSWERGETALEIDKLASLAAFYDVSLD